MAPNGSAIIGPLRQIIQYHLDNASYDNALFFAERLVAQDPKAPESVYLAALSHLQLRDLRSAYDVSKSYGYRGSNLPCAWVFAQACLGLERHRDGITALEKSRHLWLQKNNLGKHSATTRAAGPDASTLLCLLGKLYRGYGDKKKAIGFFEEALNLNPFMWDAFTISCDMGTPIRIPSVFKPSEYLLNSFVSETATVPVNTKETSTSAAHDPAFKKPTSRHAVVDISADPFSASNASADAAPDIDMFGGETSHNDFMNKIQAARMRLAGTPTINLANADVAETPTASNSNEAVTTRSFRSQEPPQAPPRRTRTAQVMESGLEAPRMNYRLGARKLTTKEREKEDQAHKAIVDIVYQELETLSGPTDKRSAIPAVERKRTISGHPVSRSTITEEPGTRRSARLNTSKSTSKAHPSAPIFAPGVRELKKARPPISSRLGRPGSSGSNVGRVVSGNRKPIEDRGDGDHVDISRIKEPAPPIIPTRHVESEAVKVEEAVRYILDLLKRLGNGYFHLSLFQCDEALQSLSSLPAAHQGTPWVLALMGRAHFEQASYPEAEKFFRKMRIQAPSRLQDMEVYSTILWHLKRETDLSFLAHELIDSDWSSPQAWCALGNAWSLARDPEQALKCFQRATQLDSKFAYAFTLQGHEHVANEEYDKALTAYRQAVAADRRHYNAYYGIGRVQERLGEYEKAQVHYQAASTINPNNAVLICCIGAVLEKQNQILPALDAYTRATELAPRAAQTRYKKARALLAIGQIEEARKELMTLKDLAPDEGTVHFLLGMLYKTMHDKPSATKHFTIALALDPKAGPKIKEAIESLEDDVPMGMDDSMM